MPVSFGWVMGPLSHWYFLPRQVIDGSVLLLGGIGFALAQRPLRSPTHDWPCRPGSTGYPAGGLNEIVHQRLRLGILAIAREARQVEFS